MFKQAMSALALACLLLPATLGISMAEDAAAPKESTQLKESAQVKGSPAGKESSATDDQAVGDKWALVIGIARFADKNLNVKYAAKDAADFRRYLVNEAGFAADHVKTLLDSQATRNAIMRSLGDEWLPRVARTEDLVVIYISTSGSPSKQDNFGANYLGAYDTNPNELFTTGIPLQNFLRVLRDRTHAKRIVAIVDASYSGAATEEAIKKGNFNLDDGASKSDIALICSCSSDQQSWESKQTANSVFTKQLIKALRTGNAATIGEAFDNLSNAVKQEVKSDRDREQSPVGKFSGAGRAIVINAPAQARSLLSLPE
jgi:uncharacterized caspase-like protein